MRRSTRPATTTTSSSSGKNVQSQKKKNGATGAGAAAGNKHQMDSSFGSSNSFDAYGVDYAIACFPLSHANSKGKLGQKKPCVDNPLCVYGLGEHRSGIWGKVEDMKLYKESGLGDNTWNERALQVPAGLENLGATCYVNSLLQTLFHNERLRTLVYEWKGESVGTGLHALALQKLFVSLDLSTATTVDPTDFVKLLNLQTGVQQDAQEFNKLLLDHLSEVMTRKLTEMFRGELEYETKCTSCGNCSSRRAHFFELELPIRGETSLVNCLSALQRIEHLTGDNQYMCDTCQKKCNAERRIVLAELPEVLNLQLLRFVFDAETLAKRKLKDIVDIPSELELSSIKDPNPVKYDLTAVLYHRGAGAHAGHYVAEVLCGGGEEKEWWVFNDDIVAKKTPEGSDGSKKKQRVSAASNQSSKDAYMLVYRKRSGNGDSFRPVSPNEATPEVVAEVLKENEERKRKLAEYTRKRKLFDDIVALRKKQYEDAFLQTTQVGAASYKKASDRYWIPTEWLESWINGERVVLSKQAVKTTKDSPIELLEDVTEDKAQVVPSSSHSDKNGVVVVEDEEDEEKAVVTVVDDAGETIEIPSSPVAKARSRSHVEFKEDSFFKLFSEPIDFVQYVCEHGKLKPSLARSKMKLIPNSLWQNLLKSGVEAKQIFRERDGKCKDCASSSSDTFTKAQDEHERCLRWEQLLVVQTAEQQQQQQPMVWISKNWAKEFRERNKERIASLSEILVASKSKNGSNAKRQKLGTMDAFLHPESKSAADDDALAADVNSDIICPHKNLLPGKNMKRLLPYQDWVTLKKEVEEGKWENSTEFASSCNDCVECQSETIEAREEAKRERETRDGMLKNAQHGSFLKEIQRRKHGHPGTSSADFWPLDHFVLVPRSFVDQFRQYLDGRTDAIPTEMNCSRFICQHGKLTISPKAYQFIVGKGAENIALFSKEGSSSSNAEEDLLDVELLSGPEFDSVMYVVSSAPKDEPMTNTTEDHSPSLSPRGFKLKMSDDGTAYESDPAFCTECMEALTKQFEIARSVFTEKAVYVSRLAIGQIPPGGEAIPQNGNSRAPRIAKTGGRSTRQGNKKTTLFLSSSDTVYLVKMKIYQASMGLKCEPSQIRLYHNGKLLDSNELTLEMMGVRAGDDLYYDTNGNEDDDLVGLVQETERGFSGTALQSSGRSKSRTSSATPEDVDMVESI